MCCNLIISVAQILLKSLYGMYDFENYEPDCCLLFITYVYVTAFLRKNVEGLSVTGNMTDFFAQYPTCD